MDKKLIFTNVNHCFGAFCLQKDRLIAASLFGKSEKITGAIYVARVRDVVSHLNACFVEISKGNVCFLPGTEMQTPCILTPPGSNAGRERSLKQGDLLLVQGIREAQKTKQPAVTTRVSLANNYFAVSLGNSRTGFSAKLSGERKEQIKSLLTSLPYFEKDGSLKPLADENLPVPSAGLIVRTQCGDVSDEVLCASLKELLDAFSKLLHDAFYRSAFTCLREPPKPWEEVLTNLVLPNEYEEIITDDETLYREICSFACLPRQTAVRLYEDPSYSLEKLYGLQTKLGEALHPRVRLKSGAYLVIEPTEAMTVIDVNSGKFETHRDDHAFIRLVNLEAADEIARQIRLRNLSGMILVDFISTTRAQDQEELLCRMQQAVQNDRIRTSVVDFTKLGLMEITRQKKNPPLSEQAKFMDLYKEKSLL